MKSLQRPLSTLVVLSCFAAAGCGGEAAPPRAATPPPEAGERPLRPGGEVSFPGRDPGMAIDEAGRVHVAYVEEVEDSPRVFYRQVARSPSGAFQALPAVAVSPPQLNVGAHGEVPPVLEVLPGGELVVAYTVRLPGQWKGEIRYQTSRDDGRSWSEAGLLHDDEDNLGSHSYLDGTVNSDGLAVFSWLDNRAGRQGLYVTTVAPGGLGPGPNRGVDSLTCECCATALLSGEDRRVWLAWRDLAGGDVRDVELARSEDGGESFEPLGRVSPDDWSIAGCPHTGPRLTQGEDGALWVAWFNGAAPGVYAARSDDGGTSFQPAQAVARVGDELERVAHPEIGRLTDDRLVVLYEAKRADGQWLLARLADAEGRRWGEPLELARQATFPRLARGAGHDVLSFTQNLEGEEGPSRQVVIRDLSLEL